MIGSPGTMSGLILRLGQCASAAASIGVMISTFGFSSYTAFCFLVASMSLQLIWSFGLACLDVYAIRRKTDLRSLILLSLFAVGDWVTALLSLAAACSSAGVTVLFVEDTKFCRQQVYLSCNRFQISVGLAFFTWALAAVSSHVMFWILI
ncbi:PREDICTED: CASP-like protein 5B1 [Tarenaya hassleriana]|uniref:CASP-like protein 5B1 n=1 Tax=Tarenaya hassleriana TaxID=28532 RepID=UPI00053C813F|nr:PREDICTED: CASP-like protein 5B1 [Tarenaya hassleriana]